MPPAPFFNGAEGIKGWINYHNNICAFLELEKVTIVAIDVLPLKAARRANIFWGFKSKLQTNPMPFHLESLCHVNAVYRLCEGLEQNEIVRVGKNSGPVLSHLRTKVHEILDDVGYPSYFPTPLPDCLCHVSFYRYSPLSLEFVKKPNICKSILAPHFFRGATTSTFLWKIVSVVYRPLFGKVWFSSSCWSPSAKPGNEVQCRIFGGWVKTHLQFEAVCGRFETM